MITFAAEDNEKKNRGFCFLDYEDHKAASYAKKKLTRRGLIFGNSTSRIAVDWADQQEEPDDEAMSKVRKYIFCQVLEYLYKLDNHSLDD